MQRSRIGVFVSAMSRQSLQSLRWERLCLGLCLIVALLTLKTALGWTGSPASLDDAMRLVQVRDLLAGQAWYTVDQSRFLTDAGGDMHWSRIPDIFISSMILALTPLLGAEGAERAALLIWPRVLLLAALVFGALILRRLNVGLIGGLFALLSFVTSLLIFQFSPGRIDHHGLELVMALAGLAALLSPSRSLGAGAALGAICVAMLSVAIESLPYAVLLSAAPAVWWVQEPHRHRQFLTGFGLACVSASVLVYVFDAPGLGSARAVCDAFGTFHFSGYVVGGFGLVALARTPVLVQTWPARFGLLAGVAGLALVVALTAAPNCLGSPYGAVDQEAMSRWMAQVSEAKNVVSVFDSNPGFAIAGYGFCLAVIVFFASLTWRQWRQPGTQLLWLFALLVGAFAVMLWQVRAVFFAHGFAAIAAGYVVHAIIQGRDWSASQERSVAIATFALLLPSTWTTAGLFAAQVTDTTRGAAPSPVVTCIAPDVLAELNQMPPGHIFAPIEMGAPLLLHTHHSVSAAPYHRNWRAIIATSRTFVAPVDDAVAAIKASGAQYVLGCPNLGEVKHYANESPDGLAAHLSSLGAEDGLERVPLDSALILYRIVHPAPSSPEA